ncbi:MAG: hypothetical protein EXR21_09150 [Flavobacteriaceae bacterium]|nr:hypothetical protein [Flavobacteriaceae bacterium]
MNRPNIRIVDANFAHSGKGSFGTGDLCVPPTHFQWYRGSENINNIVVLTESMAHMAGQCHETVKILLILEPPVINPHIYKQLHDPGFLARFTYVFTYMKQYVDIDPEKIKWFQFGGCWIRPQDQKVYTKTKNISIIASGKRDSYGQQLRHRIIEQFGHKIDLICGRGYRQIENKLEALADYRYSIVVENTNEPIMASEKLNDCFATGTIPIYWGSWETEDYYDPLGIIMLNDRMGSIHTFIDQLELATEEYYNSHLAHVQANFDLCKQYLVPEDWIWNNLLREIYNQTLNYGFASIKH